MMTWQTYSNYLISNKDRRTIDGRVDALRQHFQHFDDDIPFMDIVLSRGKKPGSYLGSIAIFLEDATFHTSANRSTPAKAIEAAFDKLDTEIQQHEADKRQRQHMLPIHNSKI